ncbi:TRAP transporter small permease [Paenibacillus sp. OAS669]|uniref:TRAP transporter small permease n=1 Tax=Paenibacillus sp. OAS669 TaxID=2663821 RepID=UPI001789A149|nr:TRAP transporter small permease [Paenibacillus sp. OAS669]MBE1444117.1 C4-dicarboxylate transporter DctQ subunit [Paenibacillus sp. OAS669]
MSDRPSGSSPLSLITLALDKFLIWVSIAVGAVLAINMIVAVFFRYVLSSPIFWADELSLYLFCWATFLGASLAVKRSDMAAVTFLLNRLPERGRILGSLAIQLSILFFAVVMGYYSTVWIMSPSVMNLLSPALSMKMWKLYLIVPISMLCMTIFTVEHMVHLLQAFFSGKKGGAAQ